MCLVFFPSGSGLTSEGGQLMVMLFCLTDFQTLSENIKNVFLLDFQRSFFRDYKKAWSFDLVQFKNKSSNLLILTLVL